MILNAAPARAMDAALLALTDVLVVNRIEAAELLGQGGLPTDMTQTLGGLAELGPEQVIVTLGAGGLMLEDKGQVVARPACPVDVISTHGAGDAFIGALAAELSRGVTLTAAADFAQRAAALHVATAPGDRAQITAQAVRALAGQTASP